MTIDPNLVNPLLQIISLCLGFVALVIIGIKAVRLFRGRETKRGDWADCLAGSSLSLSILFLFLLSVSICRNEALNTGQALKDTLLTFFVMLLSHPGWLTILLMIVLSFVSRRKKQPEKGPAHKTGEGIDPNRKHQAIWFVCTFIIGSLSATWLHFIFNQNGLSLFLLVLLLWCIAAMLVLFFWFFRRKKETIPESATVLSRGRFS